MPLTSQSLPSDVFHRIERQLFKLRFGSRDDFYDFSVDAKAALPPETSIDELDFLLARQWMAWHGDPPTNWKALLPNAIATLRASISWDVPDQPSWIKPVLIKRTLGVFQRRYGIRIWPKDAAAMINNAGRLGDLGVSA